MLELIYITNNPEVALIAEAVGVDTIMVDMEYIGKNQRQAELNTVQNHHTLDDVKKVRTSIQEANLIVRVNPIHENSEAEINSVIEAGADGVMFPWFNSAEECQKFISFVGNRAKTILLLENYLAVERLDEILNLDGIDKIHIGLNDLSLSLNINFMFQLFSNGIVEQISSKIKDKSIPFGVGGIAQIGKGTLPAEYIIKEHYRLGSTAAILSRSFCNIAKVRDYSKIKDIFTSGVNKIRELELECQNASEEYFEDNKKVLDDKIKDIVEGLI